MSYASRYNNPLHRFIRLFQAVTTTPSVTYHAWLKDVAKLLQLEPSGGPVVELSYRALMIVTDLWEDSVVWLRGLESIDGYQQETILMQLVSLRPLICPENFSSPVGREVSDLAKSLQLTASLLPSEPRLTAEDLEALEEALAEFHAAMECLKLPLELRSAMLELVRLANDLVGRYRVYGPTGLRKQFRSILGESMLLIKDLPGYGMDENDERVILKAMKKLVGTVGATLKKVGVYKDGIDLIGGVVKALSGGVGRE